MSGDYGPEFERWAARVRRELLPMIEGSRAVISIVPTGEPDVKFAVELGLAIMLDKPIVAAIEPGTRVPEKLARVVDRFVEIDFGDPSFRQRLADAVLGTIARSEDPKPKEDQG